MILDIIPRDHIRYGTQIQVLSVILAFACSLTVPTGSDYPYTPSPPPDIIVGFK